MYRRMVGVTPVVEVVVEKALQEVTMVLMVVLV
jgi:hypothetical protein